MLVDLKVIFNPFSESKDVIPKIIKMLPQLVYIDNKAISKEDIYSDND